MSVVVENGCGYCPLNYHVPCLERRFKLLSTKGLYPCVAAMMVKEFFYDLLRVCSLQTSKEFKS